MGRPRHLRADPVGPLSSQSHPAGVCTNTTTKDLGSSPFGQQRHTAGSLHYNRRFEPQPKKCLQTWYLQSLRLFAQRVGRACPDHLSGTTRPSWLFDTRRRSQQSHPSSCLRSAARAVRPVLPARWDRQSRRDPRRRPRHDLTAQSLSCRQATCLPLHRPRSSIPP